VSSQSSLPVHGKLPEKMAMPLLASPFLLKAPELFPSVRQENTITAGTLHSEPIGLA